MMAEATLAYQQGRGADAELLCQQVLARAPADTGALNLRGLLYQATGSHRLAVKTLAKAVAVDDFDPACHYNIAASYQALGQDDDAALHFKSAIALGLSGRNVEEFLLKNKIVTDCVSRLKENASLLRKSTDVLDSDVIARIADDAFLRCALEANIIRGYTLEFFLTNLRTALLSIAHATRSEPEAIDAQVLHPQVLRPQVLRPQVLRLFCALARQCFLNEYVFAQGEQETRQASELRDLLVRELSAGTEISPLLVAAVAAYFPVHALPGAGSLLTAEWPACVADLLRQQVREPLEEAADRQAIPKLTAIDDVTSVDVMHQYEENPYPRWTVNPLAAFRHRAELLAPGAATDRQSGGIDILIAGCGTGEHPFDIAQKQPHARILAVDLSLTSLAYARRKTREEGLRNIEYAQADILQLGTIGRTFARIEAVGVLHHLADPKAGWRVLLSLLAPGGTMRVGLYSETARRSIVEARALIAARGYRPTAEGIRTVRQDIFRARDEPRWERLITTVDFYSMSGCRDMLFHVMEHRLTIPEIAAFLEEQGLQFLGFELDTETIERFRRQNPGADASTDLGAWHTFETANPQTFRNMYSFTIRRKE
jgi:SAM-dependent methyltransferase